MTRQIAYDVLRANFSSATPGKPGYVSTSDLYTGIGWDDFISNPNYQNTCAIRLSLALVKSGYAISPGSHRILAGPHKGKQVQVNMARLAAMLATPAWLGAPEELTSASSSRALAGRQGIIAFHGIAGYTGGGHIDLIDSNQNNCASACYHGARSVRFWPLAQSRIS